MPKSRSKVTWWTIVSFLIGTLLGTGAIWEYKKSEIAEKNLEISQKEFEIDKALKTGELRREISQLQVRLIELSDDYIKAAGLYLNQRTSKNQNEANRILSQVVVVRDDLNEAERKLAVIEEREPREIQIDFIPPAAIGDLR